MDNKLVESHLEYIAGKVIDEDKIVTYKSLSRNLNIHVNTAKQLLYTYYTTEKSKKTFPLSATYLIAGKIIDGSFSISLVNESDLKNAESKLIEVTSEHIYSIQKGKSLQDVNCLCGVDKDLPSKSSNPVIKYFKNVIKQKEVKKKSVPDEAESKKIIKQALVPPKKPAVAESVKKVETNHKKTSPKGSAEKTENKKSTGNIANLFAKANKKNAEKPIKADVESKSIVDSVNDEEKNDDKIVEKGTSKKRSKSKESLKRKMNENKRRRIQMVSDSDDSDSDEEEKEMEMEVEEDQPPPVSLEEVVEESRESSSNNRRKKRKVIDRTVMNEEGYLETKKEVVFETESEDEVEKPKEIKPMEQKKPKVIDKEKGVQGCKKQASLLTFFKKG